ncbi:hypothetical protein, variant [Verruconis gallopava]|nr:hypothetical protein, variant [Verruconis gallopava]KIW06214.1 hypothetical protein, variant [Verruconis gallopava]
MTDGSTETRTPTDSATLSASKHGRNSPIPSVRSSDIARTAAGVPPQASTGNEPRSQAPQNTNNQPHQPSASSISTSDPSIESAARSLQQFSAPRPISQPAPNADAAQVQQAGADEEAVVYSQTRMLQDPTGRLLYVGDSATLSFLQLIRMMVETVCGPSPFTTDPRRHKIMESQFSLPSNARNSLLIPHKTTALYLVDAFFINTHGLVHVFDRKHFYRTLDTTYTDPLSADPNWLCLLNLVFAIGLTMATPAHGTPEAAVIEKLRQEHTDRAEVFYLNAKSLNDPMIGLEDADFWSVQALVLMTVFMLAKSKRNTAFALLGMAIRSAYALGLHREETLVIFSPEDQVVRRNVWRTLFIMDRFLSCSLGRPPGISEDECSSEILKSPNPPAPTDDFGFQQAFHGQGSFIQSGTYGLEAAVRSCSVIGSILKKIYQQRRVSTKLAQEIADVCKEWPKELHPGLHWRQAASANPSQGIAILHVNLLYCHSIVLLTRPFFLFILNDILQQGQYPVLNGIRSKRQYAKMEKFSEACVIASTHTIVLVQNAFEAGYLPRRNPFVIYFLFAAALILMSNEFALLYLNVAADQCIRNAITIMAYSAESDPQASRLLYILSTFRDVIVQQKDQRARQQQSANQLAPFNIKANINPYGTQGSSQSMSAATQSSPQGGLTLPSVTSASSYGPLAPISALGGGSGNSSSNPLHSRSNAQSRNSIPGVSFPPSSPFATLAHTTRPLEPSLASPAPPNPLSPYPSGLQTPALGTLERQLSFSNMFDLSNLGDRLSVDGESTGPEEHIDFDALWAWGNATPAMGSPKPAAAQAMSSNDAATFTTQQDGR